MHGKARVAQREQGVEIVVLGAGQSLHARCAVVTVRFGRSLVAVVVRHQCCAAAWACSRPEPSSSTRR